MSNEPIYKLLKVGAKGPEVVTLQKALGFTGRQVDGDYGNVTKAAVLAFQIKNGLVADGVAGFVTQSKLFGGQKGLGEQDYVRAAKLLDVPVAAVKAVAEIEARGSGFLPSGRPTILFERHKMYSALRDKKMDPESWQAKMPNIVNKARGGYLGKEKEHDRLDKARKIDNESAISSASWGTFQIMGFHWELLGYKSAADMEAKMNESEGNHLDAFVRFIKANPRIHRALKNRDWDIFASGYNGSDYASHNYHGRLADAFGHYTNSSLA